MENQSSSEQSGQRTTISVQVPSSENIASRRPLIPTSFTLAIVFFFFNFCTFQCQNQKIGSVTGFELVTGTNLKSRDMMNGRETEGEKIPANIWAIIAIGAAVIGLGVFLIKEKNEAQVGTVAGIVGFASLIILQFVINSQMHEKSQGQVEANFQFGYWGALIAFGVATLISYLRIGQTHKVEINLSPPLVTGEATSIVSPVIQQQVDINEKLQQTEPFDFIMWFNGNKKLLIGILVSTIGLFCIYYFFLKNDPEKDAKNVASTECDCTDKGTAGILKANEEFMASFSPKNFKKRQDARNKLQEFQNSINLTNTDCFNQAQLKYTKFRNKYIANPEELSKFDISYNTQKEICNLSNQTKLSETNSVVESKISSIKDAEPDIEKIKSDLLGQKILSWEFVQLSEFNQATISNTTRGLDRVEFKMKLHLVGYSNPSTDIHDAEIIVSYTQNDNGWNFNNVKAISYTSNFEIPSDNWVSFIPYQSCTNCTWKTDDEKKLIWKTNDYGSEINSGPDFPNVTLPNSNSYLVKSREGQPITIKITFRPNE